MSNDLIHLLTNRATGFFANSVNLDGYVPKTGDHSLFYAAETLRQLLKLDVTGTDWYWSPVISALRSDKSFLVGLDTTTTCNPHDHKFKNPEFSNCAPMGTVDTPSFNWTPTSLPDSFSFELTYAGDSSAAYVTGAETGRINCPIREGRYLAPDLSVLMPGVDFVLIPTSSPQIGTRVAWTIEPIRYPIKDVLQSVSDTAEFSLLGNAYGLLGNYSAITDPVFRLGAIARLIIKATKDYGR